MHWEMVEQQDQRVVDQFSNTLNVSSIIANILLNRGITTFDAAKAFFRPSWENIHDPFLMADMDKASERVCHALYQKERIFIYGDYDVDGITSVSLMLLFFRSLGIEANYYIPDRLKEGYGLSVQGIQKAVDWGANLLITVDCGITASEEVAYATSLGVDVIVCDHHQPDNQLPDAVAVLDPKRSDCLYPFKELAGVGVAFKLVQAVSQQTGLEDISWKNLVDLVALGSAADIVPLTDENRLYVSKGLELINQYPSTGVSALIQEAGLEGREIGTGQIVFMLAPRINAVGRMGDAERAVRMLVSNSAEEAKQIASVLESENNLRKSIDEETFKEAMAMIEEQGGPDSEMAVVLAKEGWHSGVIGIVASRIVERIYRPTIMIAIEDGVGKGSARSIPDFDVYSAIKKCESYLTAFGGHKYAAGLSIGTDQINDFRTAFKEVAESELGNSELIPKLHIDAEIHLDDITDKLVRILNQFAPFGPHNMRPVFMSRDLQVVGTPRIVGQNHLKLKVRQNTHVFDTIGFGLGHLIDRLETNGSGLYMAYVIETNTWNGQTKIQLRIKDLK